ncbi:MAG: helix-turn-helix transcriptional regulator [Deltaproteobacteria bacterium]|nr:helix-turn-helix transcriptional regulator [Deltaproteobacteria bacterium]
MTRKEQIIQTCMEIFSENGIQGLTMKAIADRVHITEPAIYRHFRNKEAVLVAMITQIREELIFLLQLS